MATSTEKQSLLGELLLAAGFGILGRLPCTLMVLCCSLRLGVLSLEKKRQLRVWCGAGPEFSVCFSCGARLQQELLISNFRDAVGPLDKEKVQPLTTGCSTPLVLLK